MTQNDLDKLVKYVSITLSHAHSIPLDIYLNDVVDFCRLNLVKEPISEEQLDCLAKQLYDWEGSDVQYAFKNGYRMALKSE